MISELANIDYEPFWLSLKLSFITTFILFFFCVGLAYFMSQKKFFGKAFLESIISLPLVLPPSVLGFYLLIFLSPYSFFGKFIEELFGVRLVFNFTGLVVASCIYSLPFMFGPIYAGLNSLKKSLFEASYSLGKSKLTTIFRVILPSIRSNLLTAIVVSFAHTMGEFGESKVASIAIFEAVEMLDYTKAHIYALLMLIISFFVLFVVYLLNSKKA